MTKFYRFLIDVTTNDEDKTLLTHLINLLITLSSVTNSKYYIPGETKAIEQLRRKAILCGLMNVADLLY